MGRVFKVINEKTGKELAIDKVDSPTGIITDTQKGFMIDECGDVYATDCYERIFRIHGVELEIVANQ